MLGACVSQSSYDALQSQNQQLQARNKQLRAQVAGLEREASFVEAGDLLFPEGGYQFSPGGRTELSNNIVPKLTGLLTSMASRLTRPARMTTQWRCWSRRTNSIPRIARC